MSTPTPTCNWLIIKTTWSRLQTKIVLLVLRFFGHPVVLLCFSHTIALWKVASTETSLQISNNV